MKIFVTNVTRYNRYTLQSLRVTDVMRYKYKKIKVKLKKLRGFQACEGLVTIARCALRVARRDYAMVV